MQIEIQKRLRKRSGLKITTISLIALIIIILAAASGFTFTAMQNDKVYGNIYINDLNISGMSKETLSDYLNKQFKDKIANRDYTLKTDRIVEKFDSVDIKAAFDTETAVNKVYGIGRTGSIFTRIYDILISAVMGRHLDIPPSYDKKLLNDHVSSFYNKTLVNVIQPKLSLQEDKVTVSSGRHGESIDTTVISSKVESLITEFKGGVINAEIILTSPRKLNTDDLYRQVNRDAKNASFKIENGKLVVVPHITGMKIEKTELAVRVSELDKTEGKEITLPVNFIQPDISTDEYKSSLFRDVLASRSTYFSTSTKNDKNRSENMKIAVGIISGKILAPGEIFSFNATVGPRTEDTGYLKAHTYSAGKVVDGTGGGICQISSTLYNAVLKADLDVLERRNHTFTVGYVPFGQDATVSYNTTDFKFKNSTNWPMKIEAEISKNNVYFTLIGTNETPDKKVIITNKTIKTIPFTTVYINDPTLDQGKTKVFQEGKQGFVINTYKTVKIGDKVISEAKLYTSSYIPLEQQILKGTKKTADNPAVEVETDTPQQTQTPPQQPTATPKPPVTGNVII